MFIAIAAISILAITGLTWLFNRILPLRLRSGQAFKICPICAGVSGTWLWMLAAKFLGYEIDLIIPAMLMGGSVVGIAYQGERSLEWAGRNPLFWKTAVVVIGMPLAFWAVREVNAVTLGAELVIMTWLAYFLFIKPPGRQGYLDGAGAPKVADLEKRLKNCC